MGSAEPTEQLTKRARTLPVLYAAIGCLAGFLLDVVIAQGPTGALALWSGIGALVGFTLGRQRAAELRVIIELANHVRILAIPAMATTPTVGPTPAPVPAPAPRTP